MKKILIITSSFPREKSPHAGVFIKKFIDSFSGNFVFSVLAPSDSKQSSSIYDNQLVKWVRYAHRSGETLFYNNGGVPNQNRYTLNNILKFSVYIISMLFTALIKCRSHDIIHVQWVQNGVFAILPKLIFNIPYVITVHGSDYRLYKRNWLNKTIGNIVIYFASGVITVNEYYLNSLTKIYPKKDIRYIPYGYSIIKKKEVKDSDAKTKEILFVGNLTHQKGVIDLQIVIDKILKAGLKANFSFIGDGEQKTFLKNWAAQYSPGRVKVFGLMPNKKVIEKMKEAFLLVLPSYAEGKPSVIVEAMSNGLPVIATRLKEIEEIIIDGENGKLFKPGNQEELYNLLTQAIEEKFPLNTFSEKALKHLSKKQLTREDMVFNHTKFYNKILQLS